MNNVFASRAGENLQAPRDPRKETVDSPQLYRRRETSSRGITDFDNQANAGHPTRQRNNKRG